MGLMKEKDVGTYMLGVHRTSSREAKGSKVAFSDLKREGISSLSRRTTPSSILHVCVHFFATDSSTS